MTALEDRYARIRAELALAAGRRAVRLLAVSKQQPAAAIRALAACGQQAFGENYVQEALAKQGELADLALEWHLIGPLQSNKCREAAEHFDWVQSVDREKLIPLLAKFRPSARIPLNVLIQVNIDDEASKSGCASDRINALAAMIVAEPRLRLRGLMAIPAPVVDSRLRRAAFARMQAEYLKLKAEHAPIDTLSMGMSDDYPDAIAEGANLVRIGSAIFGPRGTSA